MAWYSRNGSRGSASPAKSFSIALRSELALLDREVEPEREHRVDEAMRVPDTEMARTRVLGNLVRVVRNGSSLFDELDVPEALRQRGIQAHDLPAQELRLRQSLRLEMIRRHDDADTHDLVVERDETTTTGPACCRKMSVLPPSGPGSRRAPLT